MPDPRSILVIKPSSLGDIVHTLPAVAAIRRKWPQARISWVVNPEWAPLLGENPHITDVIEFPRRSLGGPTGWLGFPQWIKGLRERVKPDLSLDFQGLLRSAIIGRWACVKGGLCWGTSDSREGARLIHDRIVPVPPRKAPVHAISKYMALADAVGVDVSGPHEFPLPAGAPPAGVDLPFRYLLLHPFSRGHGKSLTIPEVEAICAAVAPLPVVLAGRSKSRIETIPNALDLLNRTTLPELCWLLRRAAFVASVDSGPMHLAAALHDRLLSIHTWSDPRRVGPCQPQAWVWKDDRIGRAGDFPNGDRCPRAEIGTWLQKQLAAETVVWNPDI